MAGQRLLLVLAAVLLTPAVSTSAQSLAPSDSGGVHIRSTLRAFYFNLSHQDWEALTADILPAKVVAHRPIPETLLTISRASLEPVACPAEPVTLIERATIALDGEWAAASVPRCTRGVAVTDEFRLVHFEARWRFVYVDLSQQSISVSADR